MSIKLKKFDRDCFFDYVKMFYGKGEMKNHFTDKEIKHFQEDLILVLFAISIDPNTSIKCRGTNPS